MADENLKYGQFCCRYGNFALHINHSYICTMYENLKKFQILVVNISRNRNYKIAK